MRTVDSCPLGQLCKAAAGGNQGKGHVWCVKQTGRQRAIGDLTTTLLRRPVDGHMSTWHTLQDVPTGYVACCAPSGNISECCICLSQRRLHWSRPNQACCCDRVLQQRAQQLSAGCAAWTSGTHCRASVCVVCHGWHPGLVCGVNGIQGFRASVCGVSRQVTSRGTSSKADTGRAVPGQTSSRGRGQMRRRFMALHDLWVSGQGPQRLQGLWVWCPAGVLVCRYRGGVKRYTGGWAPLHVLPCLQQWCVAECTRALPCHVAGQRQLIAASTSRRHQ
jgi:hypothetical protein